MFFINAMYAAASMRIIYFWEHILKICRIDFAKDDTAGWIHVREDTL